MAKACDGLRYGIHDGFGIGAVRFNCDYGLAMRLRRTGGFGRLFRRVGVGQSDRRTVCSKPSHDRRADTSRASEDKCDLVDECRLVTHTFSPLLTNKSRIVHADSCALRRVYRFLKLAIAKAAVSRRV